VSNIFLVAFFDRVQSERSFLGDLLQYKVDAFEFIKKLIKWQLSEQLSLHASALHAYISVAIITACICIFLKGGSLIYRFIVTAENGL
jgi:hypothetical protein